MIISCFIAHSKAKHDAHLYSDFRTTFPNDLPGINAKIYLLMMTK